jgi:MscS family membrane protein
MPEKAACAIKWHLRDYVQRRSHGITAESAPRITEEGVRMQNHHGMTSSARAAWPAAPRVAVSLVLMLLAVTMGERAGAQPTAKEVLGGASVDEEEAKPKASKSPPGPVDDFNRGVPRTAVEGFLKATREHEYDGAAQYLDLRRLPAAQAEAEGPVLARQLRTVLDRALWVDLDLLSSDPQGHLGDGLPAYRDLLGRIETPDGMVDILLQRVPRGDGVSIWKFSYATVADIPGLYQHFGYGLLGDVLPSVFYEVEFLGLQLWQLVALVITPAIAYVVAVLLTGLVLFLLRRREVELTRHLADLVGGPARLVIAVLVFAALRERTTYPLVLNSILAAIEDTLLIVAVAWTALRLADVGGQIIMRRMVERNQTSGLGLLQPGRTTVRVLIVFIAVIAMFRSFGFNVTALLAGLGVGGLAVALAAQKTVENLIGGITLFADQPVRVGDFCRFGDVVGTIEEIGLRSTRVRTLDRTVVSVPNAEFSNLHLDNFTKRDKIWFHPRIGLRYETTPDQIRYILVEIRRMLYAHPKVDPQPARIRFVEFGAFSLDLDIFAYINVTDYGEYLEVAEDLNLRIMDIVAAAGSSFAFPSQTTYIETGEGLNRDLARTAEATVKQWRQQNELYLPNFPHEQIARLRSTLDYPPAGSPANGPSGRILDKPA